MVKFERATLRVKTESDILKAHVQVGDKYIDDKLIFTGEEADELQSVANHFKTSIEPLELQAVILINRGINDD